MEMERGRLIRQHWRQLHELQVAYVPHGIWFNGIPSYFELIDLDESLQQNEIVELLNAGGRRFRCMVLDSRNSCAVIATL